MTVVRQVPLRSVKFDYHRRVHENLYFPLKTCTTTVAEDPMDAKFRIVTPNIYET